MTFPIDPGTLLTMEMVAEMSEAEINQNWNRVSECLATNRRQQDVDEVADPAPPRPPRTEGWTPVTREMLKHMSPEEINARWPEVSRVLESGGR